MIHCQILMVLFSYLRVLLSLPFMVVLNGLWVFFPRGFLPHVFSSHPIHLNIRLNIPLPHNLTPPRAILSLTFPLPHHIFPRRAPLFLSLPIPIPHHLRPPCAPLTLPLYLPHHIYPHCVPLYISIPLHLPHTPSLYQFLPSCHSCLNMIQIIQCI